MCNGRLAQQESEAALSKEQYVYCGGQKLYTAIMPARCALIRDRQHAACAPRFNNIILLLEEC